MLNFALHKRCATPILILFGMLCVGGCAPSYYQKKIDESNQRAEELEAENERKNEMIAQLTAEVIEKTEVNRLLHEELDQTRDVLEYAEKQFISLEKGLQQHETKASAVAALAEARLAYDKRIRQDPSSGRFANVRQAKVKIRKSDEMLDANRYAASVYFANRAIRLLGEAGDPRNRIVIVAVENANIRSGPGLQHDVLDSLPLGTVLIRMGNESSWYRVKTKSGVSGWIHESVTIAR